ncbi:hypothetical protein AVEN_48576-1 [Araneus ventricosus]|uniref:Uncharacterized protein n=1 Tax=Araneus ventricosus TaxID=182803 RepID=A0A4Y2HF01_ARAVE|nr:hypothetical protein AVEN_48576-1 [Araneus ventricosus]
MLSTQKTYLLLPASEVLKTCESHLRNFALFNQGSKCLRFSVFLIQQLFVLSSFEAAEEDPSVEKELDNVLPSLLGDESHLRNFAFFTHSQPRQIIFDKFILNPTPFVLELKAEGDSSAVKELDNILTLLGR